MWRDKKYKNNNVRTKVNINRWRLVVAVIFLFIGSLVYKLYSIQINQFDLYTAMASAQHQVSSQLRPDRGKIYFSDHFFDEKKLYPLATNKEFADVFVIPKDIEEPLFLAEKLFDFFDRPVLEEELRENQSPEIEVMVATSTKEEIINKYMLRLDKPGDPYEPLVNKLEPEELLKLYSVLSNPYYSSTSSQPLFLPEELQLKLGKVVLKDNANEEVKITGLGFNMQNYRFYPEKEVGSHLVGFTANVDGDLQGRYGLEEFFNNELFGKYGSIKSDRASGGSLMILNDREYIKPEPGSDIILTIDRNVQFFACDKLKEMVDNLQAEGGSVIILEPKTGEIIAMCSVPDFNPNDYRNVEDISHYNNPAVFYQYEPGSVFKIVTMAIAIDQGKVKPSTTYKDEGQIMVTGWNKPIRNSDFSTHGPHGVVDMNTVLDKSLNTGAIFAMNQVGPKVFADYVKRFGFGERTGIELGSESPGNINNLLRNRVRDIDAATASFGQGIAVTPLQMIMPYQAIANQGLMMKPHIVKSIVHASGRQEDINPKAAGRIISENTAATVSAMLVNVVEKGHSNRAAISGYYVGGKTGTAQIATVGGYSKDEYIHTFIGMGPVEDPVFVMLTKIDKPQGVQYAEGSALPLWREIADFILNYYAVPKTRK